MIAIDSKGKIEDLLDTTVLVNIQHAIVTTKTEHELVLLKDLKSFGDMKAKEKFFIAGHGSKGVLVDSVTLAYTAKDGNDVEKGLNYYVKQAVEDSIKRDKPIPKDFIIQSCWGGLGEEGGAQAGMKKALQNLKGMPSLVTALAIMLAKYGMKDSKVIGYQGLAISAPVCGATFAIKDEPSNTQELVDKYEWDEEKFRKVLGPIKDIYARCRKAAELTEAYFRAYHAALKEQGLILPDGGIFSQTGADGAKHLPKNYSIKTKESIIKKKGM